MRRALGRLAARRLPRSEAPPPPEAVAAARIFSPLRPLAPAPPQPAPPLGLDELIDRIVLVRHAFEPGLAAPPLRAADFY